jgi:hypothetical protein
MTVLLDITVPRALDALVARLLAAPPDGPVEAWLFEDAAARRAAEARLAAAGVRATLRCAYKPLLHAVLEEPDLAAARRLTVRYPIHPLAHPDRFLAEMYPLAALLDGVAVTFEPGDEGLVYHVEMEMGDGRVTRRQVFAPNRERDGALASCGWLIPPGGAGEHLPTEFETVFEAAVATARQQGWSGPGPYFERLTLRVDMPGADVDLGWGDEVVSFREAMHEDLFFTLREILTGSAGGDRHARPGQVVPDIRAHDGDARLLITLSAFDGPEETASAAQPLDAADRPLSMAQIRDELAALGGAAFAGRTRQGRIVAGAYHAGPGPAVLITSGQHANETSGPVGALRAAAGLLRQGEAHVALIPVENVDGYELHQRLIVHNPRHMHHAARYTALGDDVSMRAAAPDHERLARDEALARSGARLHINLHGYPAHEWTRPLSGYLPRGFELWSMPKGFFLIVVHHAGWAEAARTLMEAVAGRLAEDSELVAFNRRHIDAVRAHSREQPFSVLHGIPYFISEADTYATPLTLITEAPDETVHGAAFVMQQTAQRRAALACVEAYRALPPEQRGP